ncbi:unnamed protein product [Echinostoma caproni]|uniref:Uncharacterized protein n=1 Tax=Echinostoma caproni TaxID=27848 RepID=A0A3P8LAS5_9TREM|nr:unnamed protein product [Echinostoma caproni]
MFYEAAELGHVAAREWVAMGTLMGWGFYQSLPKAHSDFVQLAQEGNPRGQFGLGFMHANGLFVNASVPHALVYLTFSALGGDELAEMTMGYRHWTGLGVQESCESALTYYYRVAKKVAKEVSDRAQAGGPTVLGPMVRRVRLLDEADSHGGLFGLFGGGFMADKKNDSAQVGLGQLYYHGRHGVERDYQKAFYYFTLAAENGNALAKAYLGEVRKTFIRLRCLKFPHIQNIFYINSCMNTYHLLTNPQQNVLKEPDSKQLLEFSPKKLRFDAHIYEVNQVYEDGTVTHQSDCVLGIPTDRSDNYCLIRTSVIQSGLNLPDASRAFAPRLLYSSSVQKRRFHSLSPMMPLSRSLSYSTTHRAKIALSLVHLLPPISDLSLHGVRPKSFTYSTSCAALYFLLYKV